MGEKIRILIPSRQDKNNLQTDQTKKCVTEKKKKSQIQYTLQPIDYRITFEKKKILSNFDSGKIKTKHQAEIQILHNNPTFGSNAEHQDTNLFSSLAAPILNHERR